MAKVAAKSRMPKAIQCRHCKELYIPLPPQNEPHRTGKCIE
jgi:hypothetical protein